MNRFTLMMRAVALLSLAAALASCSSSEEGGGINLAVPEAVSCGDPDSCLSVTATWCAPGADTCSTNDIDLSLVLPGLTTVGIRRTETASLNGCEHAGDEQADEPFDRNGDGETGPFSENITCSPTAGPTPISPGEYVVEVRDNFAFFETGPIVVDIYVDGVNQREIVNVDDGSTARIPITYP